VWAAPGLHPQAASQWDPAAAAELLSLVENPEVVAIGEIGLDTLVPIAMEIQERAFREQVRIAVQAGLPVLIHGRKTPARLLALLTEEKASQVGGIFHSFSGSLQTALAAITLGFAIGFAGPVTYPNARRPLEVLAGIPAEWIVLETDAPDLPPHPHRSGDNHPAHLPLIARKVGELRGWSLEETARLTTENALRVLRMKMKTDSL
jgi:TatD DNase family protein